MRKIATDVQTMAEGQNGAIFSSAGCYSLAEKDREYDSTAALEGKQELNAEETARLKQVWKKLVRMFHLDLHEHDLVRRNNSERVDGKSDDRIMDGRIIFGD